MIDENKLDELAKDFAGEEANHPIHELIGLARRGLREVRRLNRLPYGKLKRGLYFPEWTSPPGDTILDLLEESVGYAPSNGVAHEVLSKDLSMPVDDVARLLIGDLELDEEIAEKLERRFKVVKEFWIERERKYRVQFELSQLHQIEQDWKDAAGELLVPLPEPGSDEAKILHANIMMRKYRIPELEQEIENLKSRAETVSAEVRKAQIALDMGYPTAAGALLSVALVHLPDVSISMDVDIGDGEVEQDGKTVHVPHEAVEMANQALEADADKEQPDPEGNVIEFPKQQFDGTEDLPEGARDAIEIVKTACGKVNGGHPPIVLPFLCGIGAFVVCMAREATPEDEMQISYGVAVASAKIPTTEVEAQQWIGDVLRAVSTIDGCYGVVYVTEGGSVDVYPPFAFGSGQMGTWLNRLKSLENEIKKHKPINRMPNLKLAGGEPEKSRFRPIDPKAFDEPCLSQGIPEAGIPPGVLRGVKAIGEWSIDRGIGKDDVPVTFMWGAEFVDDDRLPDDISHMSTEELRNKLDELDRVNETYDPERYPHHASIDPDSLVGAYRCLMDLRTKNLLDPEYLPDEFPLELLDELKLPHPTETYRVDVPMQGGGVAEVVIKDQSIPVPLLREYIRFRLFNLVSARMREQWNDENPGS